MAGIIGSPNAEKKRRYYAALLFSELTFSFTFKIN